MGADLCKGPVGRLIAQKVAIADQFYSQQRLPEALTIYREACQADPQQARFQFMAGICSWAVGEYEQAGAYLREALRLEPNQPLAHHGLADWCVDCGDFPAALRHSQRATELAPNDSHFKASRAAILDACGERQAAWSLVQELLRTPFRSAKLAGLYARLAAGTGQEQSALELINQLLPSASNPEQRQLRMAAAGLLDKLGRYDEAFAFARSAHSFDPVQYDPNVIERRVQSGIEYFTRPKLNDLRRASHGSRRPVFIIGMPRSGTSLVEQILASHPQIFGAGELTAIQNIVARLVGLDAGADDYPRCLDAMPIRNADRYARDYLEAINELNASSRYVTDKMPHNFIYLGIIATLFPDAHVIHCTRSALDTCLSCYLTHFAIGHGFARDLTHLGHYYRQYRMLMEHWSRVLNMQVLELRYEAVVADQTGQTQRMLEFLNLPWDDQCLSFHCSVRHVTTASRHQVKQPIYSSSVNRWRNYAKHLEPLMAALGDYAAT